MLKIADHEIDGATLLNLTERMVERLAPKMKTQCVLMNALEGLKKPVPEPIEMAVQLDDPDIENDADESLLRKTTHVDWPTTYTLPTFPPALKQSLVRKDPRLTVRERSGLKCALITCLFDQMTKYTWYVPMYSKRFFVKLSTFIII